MKKAELPMKASHCSPPRNGAVTRVVPLSAGSPIRSLVTSGSRLSFESPARTIPFATRKRERYLEDIVSGFANSEQIWHILSSLPDYDEVRHKCDALNIIFEDEDEDSDEFELGNAIYNALFSNWGVYYTVASRDLSGCAVPVFHIAHTVIHERHHRVEICDTDHTEKARSAYNRMTKLVNTLRMAAQFLPRNKRIMNELAAYLNIHVKALMAALNYKCTTQLLVASPRSVAETHEQIEYADRILKTWHPANKAEITPNRNTTPAKIIRYSHMAYVSSASRRKLGSDEDFESAIQDATMDLEDTATSTTDSGNEDLGFDLGGWGLSDHTSVLTTSSFMKKRS